MAYSSRRVGCFDGPRGFRYSGTLGRFDLGRGNVEMHVWLLRPSRLFATGGSVHRGGWHSRTAARMQSARRSRHRASVAGLGQFIAGPSSRSRARAFRSSALVSTAVPVIIAIRSGVRSRRFAGSSPRHPLANVWRDDRSFEPSNDALQPTSGAGASG